MSTPDVNTAVLDALGIPHQGQHLAAVTIRLRPGQVPSVHMERLILNRDVPRITKLHQRFTLTPAQQPEPERFDLDAACQQAMGRLAAHINASAAWHKQAMRLQTAERLQASRRKQAADRLLAALENHHTQRRPA